MSRIPLALAALALLVFSRSLPDEGVGLWLRLAAATLVLLIPGALVARAVARASAAATLLWTLAALAVALAVVFGLGTTLDVAFVVLAVVALVALPFALRREPPLHPPGWSLVVGLGAAFGVALWHVSVAPAGDGLFHLARVRKLLAFDDLSLQRVTEFADGGLHPGYAFPLWHGFLALVARLGDVDPELVVRHEASLLAPLAFVVTYEAGVALFRSAWAGAAVVVAQVALTGLASGSGGAFRSLALPATAGGRLLLVPAALALVFAFLVDRSARALLPVAAAGLVISLIHPTYAAFLALALAGFACARAVLARADLARPALALAAFAVPAVAVAIWLLPVARDVVSHNPTGPVLTSRKHGIERYPGQIEFFSEARYRLAPEVLGRGGGLAVAALCAIPLAGFAGRRRWAAFVIGPALLLLFVLLTPAVFPRFADAVSLSQARRAAGFLPLAFALAGGAVVLARLGRLALVPLALVAGIVLQRTYPGDFGYVLEDGGPRAAAWIAAFGGAAALVVGALLSRRLLVERRDALAALAVATLAAPVAWDAARDWHAPHAVDTLSPGLVATARTFGDGDVVFSDPATSYRIAAAVPVYIAVSEPTHVADTPANDPYMRKRLASRFFRSGDLAIPRTYGADWVVLDRRRHKRRFRLPQVYADERYAVYRMSSG